MGQTRMQKPLTLDLFCGIGGLSLGMDKAGFGCVGGIDHWEDAAKTFEHNLTPLPCFVADLTEVTVPEVEEFFGTTADAIDVLVGGPPCQGFSTVGKRNKEDPRNSLWRHYLELVAQIRPAYVVIENVEGLAVMEKGGICEGIRASFAEIGYRMKWKLLRSADYGVPQLRKRVFFLGWLDGLCAPEYPGPLGQADITLADAIYDLPELRAAESKTEYNGPPQTDYQKARRGRTRVLQNHEAANHSQSLIEVLKHIPDGGNRKSIPDHLQPRSGFHNSYARLASDKPAIAVTSNMRKPSSARATHPKQHRGLTVREGLRLQSFDDSFVVLGSRSCQYLQVGNAVPPLLGFAIGKEVMKAYRANTVAEIEEARKKEPVRLKVAANDDQLLLWS